VVVVLACLFGFLSFVTPSFLRQAQDERKSSGRTEELRMNGRAQDERKSSRKTVKLRMNGEIRASGWTNGCLG
tara:strand:- start:5957 stop:6175 length:219 start_codon:yes stop_codon:yes gene_type:complete